MRRTWHQLKLKCQLCDVYGEHAMSSLILQGWVRLFNEGPKMCIMIRRAADCLWWMKIWCVQLKRKLRRTGDSPLCHFPCIFLKFHGRFFTKLCLRSKKPLPLAFHRRWRHFTMKGYKNWCNTSTMVETMSKK